MDMEVKTVGILNPFFVTNIESDKNDKVITV